MSFCAYSIDIIGGGGDSSRYFPGENPTFASCSRGSLHAFNWQGHGKVMPWGHAQLTLKVQRLFGEKMADKMRGVLFLSILTAVAYFGGMFLLPPCLSLLCLPYGVYIAGKANGFTLSTLYRLAPGLLGKDPNPILTPLDTLFIQ